MTATEGQFIFLSKHKKNMIVASVDVQMSIKPWLVISDIGFRETYSFKVSRNRQLRWVFACLRAHRFRTHRVVTFTHVCGPTEAD